MREQGLAGRAKRRFRRTTDSNHTSPIAPNVLARNFVTTAPNEAWVTDVTYIATSEGWAYLAAILDLFSRRVVGRAEEHSVAPIGPNRQGLESELRQCVTELAQGSDRGVDARHFAECIVRDIERPALVPPAGAIAGGRRRTKRPRHPRRTSTG